MSRVSRRGLLGVIAGLGGAMTAPGVAVALSATEVAAQNGEPLGDPSFSWARVELLMRGLIGEIGEDAYQSWFAGMQVEKYAQGVLHVTVPVVFIRKWITAHYMTPLVRAAQRVDGKIGEVRVTVRRPVAG